MAEGTGPIIGHQGVKYGLQRPAAVGKKPAMAAAVAKPRPNVFGDDDSDDDVEAQVARQAEKKRSAKKVQEVYESALADDPTVFDYDGVYDSIQAARTQPRQQEKIERQSKYIAQLKEQADSRKREEDIRFERRLLKERVAEDHQFEGKEKFVTSAYRRKLEEDKKWVEQQKQKDLEDERNDVRKVGHMGQFYGNLLTKNVAMGAVAAQKKPATDAPEAAAAPSTSPTPEGQPPGQQQPTPATTSVTAAKGPVLDKYELLRIDAERARKAAAASGPSADSAAQTAEPTQGSTEAPAAGAGEGGVPAAPAETDGSAVAAARQAASQQLAGKRRNDEDAVMSAKERYMARKKQAQGT